jgi:AraC-like DNA-binding protein
MGTQQRRYAIYREVYMKNDDSGLLLVLRRLLSGPLTKASALHLAEATVASQEMPHGYHCHDAWELFCPLNANLRFVTAGRRPVNIPAGHLLIVPCGCWHIAVDQLRQPARLRLFIMNLPGAEAACGQLSTGSSKIRQGMTLSPAELAVWSTCAGSRPAALIEQAVQAMQSGDWGRERAAGLLRVLVAAAAEAILHLHDERQSLDARRVADAQLYLQAHYFEAGLSIPQVARAVGLSASHLAAVFRNTTGRTLHQTLLDLRLRRANELLLRSSLSIKEIAVLTGWRNQLYFSAAYRRRHGQPPSALRPKSRRR